MIKFKAEYNNYDCELAQDQYCMINKNNLCVTDLSIEFTAIPFKDMQHALYIRLTAKFDNAKLVISDVGFAGFTTKSSELQILKNAEEINKTFIHDLTEYFNSANSVLEEFRDFCLKALKGEYIGQANELQKRLDKFNENISIIESVMET